MTKPQIKTNPKRVIAKLRCFWTPPEFTTQGSLKGEGRGGGCKVKIKAKAKVTRKDEENSIGSIQIRPLACLLQIFMQFDPGTKDEDKAKERWRGLPNIPFKTVPGTLRRKFVYSKTSQIISLRVILLIFNKV